METFQPLAIALGLGLLVGFQREWSAPHVAGIRTFALITVLGAVMGLVAESQGVCILASGAVAVTALIIFATLMKYQGDQHEDAGLTTAVAAILMYGVGALLAFEHTAEGVAVGGAAAVLLHWKQPLHRVVDRIGEKDIRGIIQLVLIGLVILPVLPDKSYGPYEVFNPFEIWLLVVLIVGISLAGYIVYKFLGARVGTVLGGLLGGIISSTATTVSYARNSRNSSASANLSAVVVMIASTVVFGRVLFEIGVVAPAMLKTAVGPLATMMAFMGAISAVLFLLVREEFDGVPQPKNPSQLQAAIVFGGLYALVLFGVAMAKEHFGNRGLYIVAAASGLTEMDAITLSSAQLVNAGQIGAQTGWRLILVGAMANLVFKGAVVGVLGSVRFFLRVLVLFAIALAGGTLIMLFWPGG